MFPKIEADLDKLNVELEKSKEIKPLGKCYLFDYKTGQHKIVDGKLVECAPNEGVMQWIEKVLRTELNKYAIYTEDENEEFGISIHDYIGTKKFPMGYIASEIKREITQQLIQHRYIDRIEDYKVEQEKRGLNIIFTAVLITGETLKKEVIISGI